MPIDSMNMSASDRSWFIDQIRSNRDASHYPYVDFYTVGRSWMYATTRGQGRSERLYAVVPPEYSSDRSRYNTYGQRGASVVFSREKMLAFSMQGSGGNHLWTIPRRTDLGVIDRKVIRLVKEAILPEGMALMPEYRSNHPMGVDESNSYFWSLFADLDVHLPPELQFNRDAYMAAEVGSVTAPSGYPNYAPWSDLRYLVAINLYFREAGLDSPPHAAGDDCPCRAHELMRIYEANTAAREAARQERIAREREEARRRQEEAESLERARRLRIARTCWTCSTFSATDTRTRVSNERHVCDTCLAASFTRCVGGCRQWHRNNGDTVALRRYGNARVCRNCLASAYSRCTVCSAYYDPARDDQCCAVPARQSGARRTPRGASRLITINSADLQWCSSCGMWEYSGQAAPDDGQGIRDRDRRPDYEALRNSLSASLGLVEDDEGDEDDGSCDCGDCGTCDRAFDDREDDSDDGINIHDYSYRPVPIFRGKHPHGLFLGMELELTTSQDRYLSAQRAHELLGRDHVYVKSDSSITYGWELVTHPMTFDYFRESFPWDGIAELKAMGCKPDSSTGMHVHASKRGFSGPDHDYRWLMFWYRNADSITKLARRDPSQWGAFRDSDRRNAVRIAKKETSNDYRYSAINAQPSATYEVRIFASSIEKDQILAGLALVESTIEYTRQLSASDVIRRKGWEFAAFLSWLEDKPQYSTLLNEWNRVCAS